MLSRRVLVALCVLVLALPARSFAAPLPQISPAAQAEALYEGMTPAERVGQIFLVTFRGIEAGDGTPVYSLVTDHHVGGVVQLAENNNLGGVENTLGALLELNRQLQLNRINFTRAEQVDLSTGQSYTPQYAPLFIGISQEGDGWPTDQLLNGITRLPSFMSLGAAWDPSLAEQTGVVLGQELNTLGINLLLGPSLDVVEAQDAEGTSGLGVSAFGGDPYWVSQMGRAYIQGVHGGSSQRVAVAAKHFPGIGSADRLPEEEVSTVRKSLDQLKNFDLAPFYDVTGDAPSQAATADALLTSHMRYQGFQGNIRLTTRPISFDQQALSLLMSLPNFAAWRQNGGLVISDNLGSRSVRRFFELTNPNQAFDARLVALTAFLAGNDLLYLGNVISGEDADSYTTTVRILEFFTQKYREDPAFAARVDESALRILALKYRLYGKFTSAAILPPQDGISMLGGTSRVAFDVASRSATLISPDLDELEEALPDPPNINDRILFITDERLTAQCSLCPTQPLLAVDALQQAVLRLYGPQATGQVTPMYLKSYTYQQLTSLLDNERGTAQLDIDIRRARWLVFAMLDVRRDLPSSLALHRLLSERPDLLQQKRLVAFSFNAPTFLDATDISKLTAYFGLYSKTPAFVDMAARLLFKELPAAGSAPVSVPGVGYDLISAMLPDPDQVIPLLLDLPEATGAEATPPPTSEPLTVAGTQQPTEEPTPLPAASYRAGSQVAVRTGVIQDHNGHPVPDGTPVQFITSLDGNASGLPLATATLDGIARVVLTVSGPGLFEIRVESDTARTSEVLRFEIPAEFPGEVTPTPTEEPTATTSPSPTFTATPELADENGGATPLPPGLADWIVAVLLASAGGFLAYQLSAMLGQVRWGVRSAFLAFIGGMLGYTALTLESPTSQSFLQGMGGWGVILAVLAGCLVGGGSAWLWRMAQLRPRLDS